MILAKLGKLCVAQDLTATTQISDHVIYMPAIDWGAVTDVWLVIDTETIATGDASDTYAFHLVMSAAAALTSTVEVLALTITGYADHRLATAGNRILAVNLGKQLNEMLGTSLSDYPYIGLSMTVSTGGTLSVNAQLSPTEPRTIPHAQTVVSNVGVPAKCSADS